MTRSKSYNDILLDHYKNPRNYGRMDSPELSHEESNSLCGDKIHIEARVENNRISEIRFDGRGCAISIAAMSMLSEMLKGKSIEECEDITDDHLLKALGVPVKRSRLNCALLGLKAFRNLLKTAHQAA